LSLAEISAQMSISRQGVHDSIKKSDKQLDKLESSLKLVNHFVKIKHIAKDIYSLSEEVSDMVENQDVKAKMNQLNLLTKQLVDTL
ncbi:MAG: DNA-binding protein, partial [Vallitaleaceae bacterium]|nr:DNA-binding protein [Vallitaleaceae bacterium]